MQGYHLPHADDPPRPLFFPFHIHTDPNVLVRPPAAAGTTHQMEHGIKRSNVPILSRAGRNQPVAVDGDGAAAALTRGGSASEPEDLRRRLRTEVEVDGSNRNSPGGCGLKSR